MRRVSLAIALGVLLISGAVATPAHGATANDPPLADAGLDQRVERGAVVWLDGGGSVDPDGEVVAYEWSIRTPAGETIRPEDPAASSTTFTPTAVGRYEVTLTVTDDDGATRSDTLYVDVTAPETNGDPSEPESNEPPTGEIEGPDTVARGERATFTADVYDPDGEIVAYEWSNGRSGRAITRTVDRPAGETFEFTVRVTDDDGATSTFRKSVRVRSVDPGGSQTVDPANEGPTATIEGLDRVAVGETATYVLRGRDSDGTVAQRLWPDRSGTGAVLEPAFDEAGTYTLRGVVVDDDGARTVATKSIEVYEEGPPVAEISGPDTASAGSTQTYTLEASDPDGGELTVRWEPSQSLSERANSEYRNRVDIEGELGDTVEVSAFVTDDEGNTVVAVKETDVEAETDFNERGLNPQVSEIRWKYYLDNSTQTSEIDSVELGTYFLSAKINHGEQKTVRATWEINDSKRAIIVDTLGVVPEETRTNIKHTFVSPNGKFVSREVTVSAVDSDGDRHTRKRIDRFHSVQSHDDILFYATGPESSEPARHLEIEPGEQVVFTVGSYQNYRLEFGDGTRTRGSGTRAGVNPKISHSYDNAGRYRARLISTQGPKGEALRTIDILVKPESYTEYWYKETTNTTSQVISENSPAGSDWTKKSVRRSTTYYTGKTVTLRAGSGRAEMLGDGWEINETTTEQRTKTVSQISKTDPDGTGDKWRLNKRSVRTKERTFYENKYRWMSSQFRRPGWTFTGETRTEKVIVGDGHDHDRTRHKETTRTCTDWDLEPSPFGGLSRQCTNWKYDTDIWYTGHEHSGRSYYDKEYQYKTEVAQTETVHYHEYIGERTQTVTLKTFAETKTQKEWLWERKATETRQKYSLQKPDNESYIAGTLKTVEVRCGTNKSHHDAVMC